MRTNLFAASLPVIAAAMTVVSVTVPARAQQYRGPSSLDIGTIGDLSKRLIDPGFKNTRLELNFGPTRLYPGSETYFYDRPDFVAIPIPHFADYGYDFSDYTFGEYLNFVANSYKIANAADYYAKFSYLNEYTVTGQYLLFASDSLSAQFESDRASYISYYENYFGVTDLSQLSPDVYSYAISLLNTALTADANNLEPQAILAVHQEDFIAGGGYIPLPGEATVPSDPFPTLDDPTIPDVPDPAPPDFTPFPDPAATAETQTADAVTSSESRQPASVAVPEPATLGLLSLAAAGCLIRRR